MNEERRTAIMLLDRLVAAESRRRTDSLLYPKSDDLYLEWMFVVGRHFRDAFDIKYTTRTKEKKEFKVWTQGSGFSVKVGYTFHAVHDSDLIIQALEVAPAVPASKSKNIERDKGYVKYYMPKRGQTTHKQYETTQDDFLRMLITGEGIPLDEAS